MSTQRTINDEDGAGLGNFESLDLYEEELSAEKHLRDIGDVRLSKRVVTTQKQITVPVMHEEVDIERVPYDRQQAAPLQETTSSFDPINIPLCEEELSAEKHTRPAGEVKVHKRLVVTQKQITVPVMHEEISIERIAAKDRSPVAYSDGMFVESTQVIPLHDEEVAIHKMRVPRESVRLTKSAKQEDLTTTAQLRREELDIEEPTRTESWSEDRSGEFTEDLAVIPLYEEEVELHKYPVVREEVRIDRAALQENRTATSDVYKEELDIEEPEAYKARYRQNGAAKGSGNGSRW